MKNKILFLGLAGALMFTSCYEDEGNYTYDESIKDISVQLNKSYGLKKSEDVMTYTITPKIQTPDGNKQHLKYAWTMNTTNANTKGDTISTSEALTLTMDPKDAKFSYKYYLRLYVEDTQRGTLTMVPTELSIIKPYSDAWVVLHDDGGHAELGSVEFIGDDALVTTNAYSKESGKSWTGAPLCLGVSQEPIESYLQSYWGFVAQSKIHVVTTNPEESGLYNQVENFKLMAPFTQLTDPGQQQLMNFSDMQFSSSNSGMVLCTNGKCANNGFYSPFYYMMVEGDDLFDDYYISKVVAGPHTALGFDKLGHRFLHLALQKSGYWYGYTPATGKKGAVISPIPYNEGNKADPNQLDPNEEIVAMIPGYKYSNANPAKWQRYYAYAYTIAPGNKSHVYVFSHYALTHAGEATVPYSFVFPTPNGVNVNTPMASSFVYNNILFYGVDNKVYKLDFATGQSTLIWQSEDTKAKVTCLKMAIDNYSGWGQDDNLNLGADTYGHPFARCLGVGVATGDGKGEFVLLQLSTAGKVDADGTRPAVQVFKGFGKVKDVAFI